MTDIQNVSTSTYSSEKKIAIGVGLTLTALIAIALLAKQACSTPRAAVGESRALALPASNLAERIREYMDVYPEPPRDLTTLQQLVHQHWNQVDRRLIAHWEHKVAHLDTLRLFLEQEGARGLSQAAWVRRLSQIQRDFSHPLRQKLNCFIQAHDIDLREMARRLSITSVEELLSRSKAVQESIRSAQEQIAKRI